MGSTTDETEVLAIFEMILEAMRNNDVDPLRTYVAEDYRGSDAGGRIHDRVEMLQAYGPGGVALDLFVTDEIDTTWWSDTVLVMGTARIRGRFGEHEFEHDLRFLDVYGRRSGDWKLVASHICDRQPD